MLIFKKTLFLSSLLVGILLLVNTAPASDTITVKHHPVDHAKLYVRNITKDQPILIRLFDTQQAKLGKAKHQDIARMLAKTAPHILAADIVELLRDSGFTNVLLEESDIKPSGDHMILTGEFTSLNPGSEAVRAWVGFGAGKSKICVEGQIDTSSGTNLARFSDCSSGLGWGGSGNQMDEETDRIGRHIADLVIAWAEGTLK